MLFYTLSKCLPLFILPLGFALGLLTLYLRFKRQVLVVASILTLLVLGTPAASYRLISTLENRYSYPNQVELASCDAAFIFGGILGPRDYRDGDLSLNDAGDRFEHAVSLYQVAKIPHVVFSGGLQRYPGGPTEGELLKSAAVRRGIPPEDISVTPAAANTAREAEWLAEITKQHHWRRVAIVSSAYHLPRAAFLSSHCPAQLIPVPVGYLSPDLGSSWITIRPEFYLPQAEALSVSERAIREYVGLFTYKLIKP